MRITTKHLKDLTPMEYAQCYSLNMAANGTMRSELTHQNQHDGITIIHMAHEGKQLLGWAMQIYSVNKLGKPERTYFIQIYVRKERRREGIGTALIDAVKEHSQHRRLRVSWHNGVAASFFKSVGLRSS